MIEILRDALHYYDPVRTGISLSGGLDSSTVAMLSDPMMPTITGYYADAGYDERAWARLVAHPEHVEVKITPEDFVTYFDDMCQYIEYPVMGMGTFGQFMVARAAFGRGLKVVLSGEGSDELFGGYARQALVAGEKLPEGYEDYKLPADYPTNIVDALDYDWQKLPDLLAVDNQMLGAFKIDAAAPFLTPAIIDYALKLPVDERIGKRHLRKLVRGIVPDAIIDRKDKKGFPAPLVAWAQKEPVKGFVLDRLGYLPDPDHPWDREWWVELVMKSKGDR